MPYIKQFANGATCPELSGKTLKKIKIMLLNKVKGTEYSVPLFCFYKKFLV